MNVVGFRVGLGVGINSCKFTAEIFTTLVASTGRLFSHNLGAVVNENANVDPPVIAAVYHFPQAACTTRWPSRTDIHSGSSDRWCREAGGRGWQTKKQGWPSIECS